MSVSASVVGGYGSLLVFFAIASTLTVNVRQRGEEIHLLRCTGATPAQIRRMVVGRPPSSPWPGAARHRARDARRPGPARHVQGQRSGRR
ncbi:FtsX-like permease family protein [Streptomyces sp. M10(2022)]